MIGRLTGRVVAHEAGGAVVVDVGGVGYEVFVPAGTLGRARPDDAGRVTLWVHTHVREESFSLFGFDDDAERAAFRMLLGVSNIGPKIAIAVLGALPAPELARAVAAHDLSALTAVPGVGKKIAERLLLELRDKLPALATAGVPPAGGRFASAAAPAANGGGVRASAGDRLRGALTGMGFKPGEAERVVTALVARAPGGGGGAGGANGNDQLEAAPFEDMLREALALLAK